MVYLTSGDAPLLEAPEQLRSGERRELIKRGKRRFVFKRAEAKGTGYAQTIQLKVNFYGFDTGILLLFFVKILNFNFIAMTVL